MGDLRTNAELSTLPLPLELEPLAARIYAYSAAKPTFNPADLADPLGLEAAEVESAMRQLVELGLVRPAPGRDGEMTCVSPESAADLLLAPIEQEIRQRRGFAGQVRAGLQSLVPHYEAGLAARRSLQPIEVVVGLSAVRQVIEESARRCVAELVTSQPGGGRSVEALEEAVGRDEDMLRRGVQMRTIYQHTARYDAPTASYVERVSALGAQVRTLGDRLMRMIVFDRETGIMDVRGHPHSAVVIREPNIVDFMIAAFDQAWLSADPFPTSAGRSDVRQITNGIRSLIIGLLAEGHNDKVIARRLGMSERTCQRYVRQILDQVGAHTRFQAGYVIGVEKMYEIHVDHDLEMDGDIDADLDADGE
jgi:sugar-specific transcriptional regulator TrmB